MTIGGRGQLPVSRPTCLFTCFKLISSSKFYITLHIFTAYILCKAYDIQSTWTYTQVGTVQEGCDCPVSYTQEQVSFTSL